MAQLSSSLSIFLFLAIAFTIEVSAGSTNGGLNKPAGAEGSVHVRDCPDICDYRCSTTSPKKLRLVRCKYCCQRCLCVPSGTSGNNDECPCYRSINIFP